jgi:hypothetical protein
MRQSLQFPKSVENSGGEMSSTLNLRVTSGDGSKSRAYCCEGGIVMIRLLLSPLHHSIELGSRHRVTLERILQQPRGNHANLIRAITEVGTRQAVTSKHCLRVACERHYVGEV